MGVQMSWANQKQFASFWAHHEAAEKWRQQHKRMVAESLSLLEGVPSGASESILHYHVESTSMLAPRKEVESEEMEVDEEYLEFRRITLEHQKKREEKQKAEASDGNWLKIGEEEYVMADQIGVHGVAHRTLDEPDERAKTQRKRAAAKELYGPAAEKLLAMETAMDMHFNEVMRTKEPPLWPNIPLKI